MKEGLLWEKLRGKGGTLYIRRYLPLWFSCGDMENAIITVA